MKPKTMILMGVAIACGLGASYMTSRLLAERGDGPPPEVPKVVVLVAKKNLDMGAFVKSPNDLFVEKQFARGDEPKNAVVAYDVLKNKYLKRSLRKEDWITPDDLADSIGGINWQLPEGHRAIGIRVSTEGIAGGWASLPGSRVDIISTIRRGNDDDSFSQVLLEDVLVLAADGANTRNEQGTAMPASVLTLALNAEDAVKVTLASQLGPLHLMLRKQGDKAKIEGDRVTVTQVIRNTGGGRNDAAEKENWEQSGEPVNPKLEIPAIKAEEQGKDVAKVEPGVKTHVITFIEGETQRKVVYRLGDNDEVLSSDVPDSDSKAKPQQTPPAQPPAPPAQPPAPPAQPPTTQQPPAPPQPTAPPAPRSKGRS
jgi:pilus assembly protein CpaB